MLKPLPVLMTIILTLKLAYSYFKEREIINWFDKEGLRSNITAEMTRRKTATDKLRIKRQRDNKVAVLRSCPLTCSACRRLQTSLLSRANFLPLWVK